MKNVYEFCPSFESENYVIRQLQAKDIHGLLKIYSDTNALPFFNADNCHGDDFHYTTLERMQQAIDFWEEAYKNGWFVRWSVVDKRAQETVGTIEAFHRTAEDHFTDTCLVRLDLRSDYETEACIAEILQTIEKDFFDLFYCEKLATKGFPNSPERLKALRRLSYCKSDCPLVGSYDKYFDYWEKAKA